MKPVPDKAEVALDFPDKAYMGTFERGSVFEAHAGPDAVTLKLERRSQPKRAVEMHLHYDLFAGILEELAESIAAGQPIDAFHRGLLLESCTALEAALRATDKPDGR